MDPTFPVCTFERVFDTSPLREVLTLAELVACFRRFDLRPELAARVRREVAGIDRALEEALAGGVGKAGRGRRRAALASGDAPQDERALRERADKLRSAAQKEAKRDLRLWSPALYRDGDGVRRGTEDVLALSCLVLDYDSGIRIGDAAAAFQDYFHLIHSTWSHTPEHPKFRIILPLAVAVTAARWSALWEWAEETTGGEIDPAPKGPAATYALPAVASPSAPREALTHAAPLLDPRELGIDVGPPSRLPLLRAPVSPMRGEPDKEYVVHDPDAAVYVYDDPEDEP